MSQILNRLGKQLQLVFFVLLRAIYIVCWVTADNYTSRSTDCVFAGFWYQRAMGSDQWGRRPWTALSHCQMKPKKTTHCASKFQPLGGAYDVSAQTYLERNGEDTWEETEETYSRRHHQWVLQTTLQGGAPSQSSNNTKSAVAHGGSMSEQGVSCLPSHPHGSVACARAEENQ